MTFRTLLFIGILGLGVSSFSASFLPQPLSSVSTGVQPFTGIVFWAESESDPGDANQLEFSYMLYNSVVKEKGVYNWKPVDSLLEKIASRRHQAILRFRYAYPGFTTSVPDYIKNSTGYEEVSGVSEGLTTYFPDWRSMTFPTIFME